MQAATSIDYKALYEQSQLEILQLKQQLDQLRKMIFGSRHERFIPSEITDPQLSLDIQVDAIASYTVSSAQKISYVKANVTIDQKPLVHPGRMKLPEHLRREEIIIDPAEDITGCKKMGEEIIEVLEYQPGELYVKQSSALNTLAPLLAASS
jgi:predicted metal-dependent HD superfamily phosphohydrolase